jgi:HD-like signal output (HDOD) protein/ActR/RegA family two-component response regulator
VFAIAEEMNASKKSILFVDDDPLILRVYGLLLGDARGDWHVSSALGAKRALELMERQSFDVIATDMRMPGMTGAELAAEVQRRYPTTSRIIISGLSDKEEVVRCLGATHQFLPKPFDTKALRATLACLGSLDAFLRDDRLKALVAHLDGLPSFPSLYLEITRELATPIPSMERVAGIVGRDPAMTAKMLQIVNSVVFGLARKVSNPFDAVQFLGMGTVRSLALSLHAFANFERANLRCSSLGHLWEHSVRTGTLARVIMQTERADPEDAEDAYVAGMLHDLGKLMLADSLPDQFQRAHQLAVERGTCLHEAELELYGATHAGVGAYLLGLWGLPAPIVEAVAFHHSPGHSDLREFSPLTAVHAADVLEHELFNGAGCLHPSGMNADYLATLGKQDRLDAWRAEAEKLAKSAKN